MKLIFPQAVLDQHLIALGKTGAGKSSALRHIVEWLLSHNKRVCIVDPKGDWYGLKASADGKGPGYPVVLFGDFKNKIDGDVPLIPRSQLDNPDFDLVPAAEHVAKLVISGNRPCVIGMRGWTQGAMTRFWIKFASSVFNSESGELYLTIDEIHNFAPKGKVLSIDAGKSLHWTNRIINEGRGIGLQVLAASQRPQKVHNDTLDACETLVAMRVVHPAARKAIKDWLDGAGDKAAAEKIYESLASLERGEAYVWSPEIKFGPEHLRFPMFETYDSFAPPKMQKKVSEKGWATVDLTEIREKLARVIEQAKAEDPVELRKEIAALKKSATPREQDVRRIQELEEAIKTAPKAAKGAETRRLRSALETAMKFIVNIEAEGFSKEAGVDEATVRAAIEGAISKITADMERKVADRDAALTKLRKEASNIILRLKALASDEPIEVDVRVAHQKPFAVSRPLLLGNQRERRPVPQTPRAAIQRKAAPVDDDELSGPERRILDAIAWLDSLGIQEAEQTAVAFLAGYTYGGGGFNNPKGRLNTRGFVTYISGNKIALTDEGRARANFPETVLTTEELQRKVLERLSGPERKILQVLIDHYPNAVTNEDCAAESGYTAGGGGFNNPKGRLRSLGLIDYPERNYAVAKPLLFLE